MSITSLRILSFNVASYYDRLESLLLTSDTYDIILVQEAPVKKIRSIPSDTSPEGTDFHGAPNNPNWFYVLPTLNSRVMAYINKRICCPLQFALRRDIINHRDVLVLSFILNHKMFSIINVYS